MFYPSLFYMDSWPLIMLAANILPTPPLPPKTSPNPLPDWTIKKKFTFTNEFILKMVVTLNFKRNHNFRELS